MMMMKVELVPMLNTHIQYLLYLLITFTCTNAFIPTPLLADGGLTSDSITHTEITQLGFIRCLARFFYDTRIQSNNINKGTFNEQKYFTTEYTIDDLYKLAHPNYNAVQIEFYSLPLKLILDTVMTFNALVDFDSDTKKLSPAHFDSEAFISGSRRILQLRRTIITNTRGPKKDLRAARISLGQALHTLQDFYSHSNWIEMGKTDINDLIGQNEIIGTVAKSDQATCTDNGCTKIEKSCSIWQLITLQECPLVYYDCENNILPEINNQQILTSGYLLDQRNENNEPVSKPTNVNKCSHGSVMDESVNIPAIGGINKDSHSLVFSPHSDLHFQAVDLAVKATGQFLNDLRRDIGDENFNDLFLISPTEDHCHSASDAVAKGQRFRFFTPLVSTTPKETDSLISNLKNWIIKRVNMIKLILANIFSSKKNIPTYDLTDLGVNTNDRKNFRAGPYVLASGDSGRKRHLINLFRKHQK